MNLTLRRGTKAGIIDGEQHDALMALAPSVETNGERPTPEAEMVMALYNECGGAPVASGMAGVIDRRAEVVLPRLALAERTHPGIDPEFFRGLFGWLDSHYVAELSRKMSEAAEASRG